MGLEYTWNAALISCSREVPCTTRAVFLLGIPRCSLSASNLHGPARQRGEETILTDAEARDNATGHFLNRALRETREAGGAT